MKKLKLFGLLALVMLSSVMLVACANGNGGNGMLELNPEIALQIRQDYISTSFRDDANTIDEVFIHFYYGTFNGNVVLAISGSVSMTIDIFGGTETVAGRTFSYPQIGHQILVWSDGTFYTLSEAYAQNLLTSGNITTIWNLFQNQD